MSAARFASALSTYGNTAHACQEACAEIADQLEGEVDLAFAFYSHEHRPHADRLVGLLAERLRAGSLLGCTGESIIGGGQEVEEGPALAVWAARLPGVAVQSFALTFEATPDGGSITGWPDALIRSWPSDAAMILLAEPFSFPTDALLQRLNEDHPGMPVMGGMASGAATPGENQLLLGSEVVRQGAVAVMLHGAIRLRPIVSQGCRPIGQPMLITRAERNEIFELGGKPALLRLKEVFDTLPTSEQQMVQRGLHVGRVVNEYQDRFEAGDFLVRNVIGLDPARGAIVVGDFMRAGQTVQFHIRDEHSASHELQQLLAGAGRDGPRSAGGGLLFTCNGRGTRLFSTAHHDASAVIRNLGQIPLAGFFAQGEIGPVSGRNFVHGFTASVVLFQPS